MAARNLIQILRNFISRSKRTDLESADKTRIISKNISISASEDLKAAGETVDIKAEKVAKLDGESVRLG
jgi:hypothetical protein